jgi:hypothetical protein
MLVGNAGVAAVRLNWLSYARTPSEWAPSVSAGVVHDVPGAGTVPSTVPVPSTYTRYSIRPDSASLDAVQVNAGVLPE